MKNPNNDCLKRPYNSNINEICTFLTRDLTKSSVSDKTYCLKQWHQTHVNMSLTLWPTGPREEPVSRIRSVFTLREL
uniref:Uncharacterized protein n=1 Tax=Anguilla anguilla TaxID=7936 RepID=A0A0E9PQ60_ANGAN